MAFTATVALVSGAEAFSVGLALAAVAEVGMAVTLVGAVTGNKDMMKVGTAMSLVGGIGSMVVQGLSTVGTTAASDVIAQGVAEGAATEGAGSALAGMSYEATAEAALNGMGEWAAEAAATEGLGQAASSVASDAIVSNAMNSGTNAIAQGGANLADAMVGTTGEAIGTGAADVTTSLTADTVSNSASMVNSANGVQGATAPVTPMDNSLGVDHMIGEESMVNTMGKEAGKQSSRSMFDGIKSVGKWAEKNKTLAGMMLQIGGNVMQASYQADAQEEANELRRREIELAERRQHNRSVTAGGGLRSPVRPIINGVIQS